MILGIAARVDGGDVTSRTMRRILQDYHGVEIGMYSYGGCFDPSRIAPLTKIGRYCSFAHGVVVLNANHPLQWKSTHPFFYHPQLGFVAQELIARRSITIGNDVWVGYGALILPGVARIGDGAVIGAGAVVTKDVPDFALVAGNPARVLRYRFPEDVCRHIKASQWWERDIDELDVREFTQPVSNPEDSHLLWEAGNCP